MRIRSNASIVCVYARVSQPSRLTSRQTAGSSSSMPAVVSTSMDGTRTYDRNTRDIEQIEEHVQNRRRYQPHCASLCGVFPCNLASARNTHYGARRHHVTTRSTIRNVSESSREKAPDLHSCPRCRGPTWELQPPRCLVAIPDLDQVVTQSAQSVNH